MLNLRTPTGCRTALESAYHVRSHASETVGEDTGAENGGDVDEQGSNPGQGGGRVREGQHQRDVELVGVEGKLDGGGESDQLAASYVICRVQPHRSSERDI
ncbi:MAG: hypothetical protein M3220_16835 [Chloroflexota bacterium]|nr:hypothetical protein [Chloroflexota bacterium]